ncbi:LysR family transcriptional regulator [Azospirillum sp. ST 5-10]|uniref:LysR family transcriptional regulator n=1 Tax=unclassified Azospirillum TaxID=2630922 RepID=UPI003F4A35AF
MDTYLNLRAFLATADAGNFSQAARELGVAASVVTKRVNQLEHQLGIELFRRSTRSLTLTEAGRKHLDRCRSIVAQIDDLIAPPQTRRELEDFIRVRAPVTMTRMFLGAIIQDFLTAHPKVRLELVISERPIVSEGSGFDVSIGAVPVTVGTITDVTLCRLRRFLCASPAYLARFGRPESPRDLVHHTCLNFMPSGAVWVFRTGTAPIELEVAPRLSSNDGQLIVDAAAAGMGIAAASEYVSASLIGSGRLVPVLEDHPLPEFWIKATLPANRPATPAVQALIGHLKAALSPVAPWERAAPERPAGDGAP